MTPPVVSSTMMILTLVVLNKNKLDKFEEITVMCIVLILHILVKFMSRRRPSFSFNNQLIKFVIGDSPPSYIPALN